MKVIENLRTWWQQKTGEEETPFDGDAPVWLISMLFHLGLMFVLAFITIAPRASSELVTVIAPLEEEQEELDELETPEQISASELPNEDIGANSVDDSEEALSLAPIEADTSEIPNPELFTKAENATLNVNEVMQVATGLHAHETLTVKGSVGEGVTGAAGAVDRITQEILLSMEERPTLVVWIFDQSASLLRQRESINDRFAKIYDELGVVEAAGNPAFAKSKDKPLLTSVVGFGKAITETLDEPTDNLAEIQRAVKSLKRDDSGKEYVFSAIFKAAEKFKKYRVPNPQTGQPDRNVMIVVFTDEVGDDQKKHERDMKYLGLETTVQICRRYEMPVYVVGVPAPFGRKNTLVKWVDPDPKYNQDPQWAPVNQGPESLLPERVKLHFSGTREDTAPIDSGFGPFALTRLCYETGGMYFSVHPNRNVNRAVGRGETAALSAHMKHFFDPTVMRRYRPDYVSAAEYDRRAKRNGARASLLKAAGYSWVKSMESPAIEFVKRDEASFATALFEAQKKAANLSPRVKELYGLLKLGEADRKKETSLRWQAGYDLAMGRVMAVMVRTDSYNATLALAKRGLKFKKPKSNTWELIPSGEDYADSKLKKNAQKATEYLQRVVDEHPNTPWALLAKRELEQPFGWKWQEKTTDLEKRKRGAGGGNNNAAAAADEKKKMLKRKGPMRKPPPL